MRSSKDSPVKKGDRLRLAENVVSHLSLKTVYGRVNDYVTVISADHFPMLLVQHEVTAEKFAVPYLKINQSGEELEQTPIEQKKAVPKKIGKAAAKKKANAPRRLF